MLWGSSYSGGHVLALAAADPRFAAVIAQAPYTDSIATLTCVPPRNIGRFAVEALRDQLVAWLGRPPRLVPIFGAPGTFAMITAPGYESTFAAIRPHDSKWRNEFAARLMFTFGFYRPGLKAKHLKMPLLITVRDGRSYAGGAGGPPSGHVRSFRNLRQVKADHGVSADSAGSVRVIGGTPKAGVARFTQLASALSVLAQQIRRTSEP